MHLAIDDVVSRDLAFGVITACTEDLDGTTCVIVDVWERVGQIAPNAFRCERCNYSQAWLMSEVEQVPCWYAQGEGLVMLTYC